MTDRGIVYYAIGEKHKGWALRSARSAKAHMDLPISVISNVGFDSPYVDKVIYRPGRPDLMYVGRLKAMADTPYQDTLFLDCDTHICADASDAFELLGKHDLAVRIAPIRCSWPFDDIPDAFPEMNPSVWYYRNSPQMQQFFRDWEKFLRAMVEWEPLKDGSRTYTPNDMSAFRHVLYNSDLRLATLPSEYQLRPMTDYAQGRVKIIHTYRGDMAQWAGAVNRTEEPRVFIFGKIYTRKGLLCSVPV